MFGCVQDAAEPVLQRGLTCLKAGLIHRLPPLMPAESAANRVSLSRAAALSARQDHLAVSRAASPAELEANRVPLSPDRDLTLRAKIIRRCGAEPGRWAGSRRPGC